jgi:hypothetical protein
MRHGNAKVSREAQRSAVLLPFAGWAVPAFVELRRICLVVRVPEE